MIIQEELEKIKRILNIEDSLQDELIADLWASAIDHFKALTGAYEVEDKYLFIIRDVTLKRYNRKGSEGISQENVNGYSSSYLTEDFKDYLDFLSRDFGLSDLNRKKGRVSFL